MTLQALIRVRPSMVKGLEVFHRTYTNKIKLWYESPNLENKFTLYITAHLSRT